MLGHSSLKTTKHYLHSTEKTLKDIRNKANEARERNVPDNFIFIGGQVCLNDNICIVKVIVRGFHDKGLYILELCLVGKRRIRLSHGDKSFPPPVSFQTYRPVL
jgi:hypothetical protein